MNASGCATWVLAACAVTLLLSTAGCANQSDRRATAPAVAAGVAPPKKSCRPDYHAAALRAKAQGTSVIKFTVDATGVVTKTEIVGASGPTPEHRLLDQAAASALAACPLKPGVDATGAPVGTTVEVRYRWVIGSPEAPAVAVTPR